MNIKEITGNKKMFLFAAIIVSAILFMLFGNIGFDGKEQPDTKQELEHSLENVLATVENAGKVKVFVYLSDNGVKNFEKDIRKNNDTVEEKTVLSGNDPAVVKYSFPSVKGIIITAEGAADETVRQNLKDAAETALGVPSHRICVLTGK